eukprot:gnl/Spiro4/16573_TR8921_c0_g1_i1.p1 gnl/Spiro4/16573_TR8921_c0_g1~~gnl/Spiro4/16573_TR8921_c0_g1_i1.p1  ORF type:complete len:166 (+),score=42.05 gnl/Spiro4/16573_TR8921_c0_g1_i1:47-544(+)
MAFHGAQSRLFLSAAVMFLFFGLLPALPPLHFNKELFPGTRHMYTLHVEATQNGIMLFVLAFLLPYLELGALSRLVFEISANLGAWFNVFPWLYGALHGAVLKFGDGQQGGNHLATPPANNAQLAGAMETMLMLCALGDLIAWGIVVVVMAKRAVCGAYCNAKKD